jgi:hypothetical protein
MEGIVQMRSVCIHTYRGGQKGKFFMSRHMNLALGVLSTLFRCSFAVVMFTVLVVSLLG